MRMKSTFTERKLSNTIKAGYGTYVCIFISRTMRYVNVFVNVCFTLLYSLCGNTRMNHKNDKIYFELRADRFQLLLCTSHASSAATNEKANSSFGKVSHHS